MLATAWLDVLFVPLLLAGIETIDPVPGTSGGYGNVIIHADYTYSLVGALVIAVLFGLVAAVPWGRRTGAVLRGVVFSHWLLDLVIHRSDMPILPDNIGDLPRLGFGLWRVPTATAGRYHSFLYWQAANQTARAAGTSKTGQAHLVGGLMLIAGVATLVVDSLVG
jgi:hypothetical protein